MNIIILILIALGSLNSTSDFTEEYKLTHQDQINKATAIYNAGDYREDPSGGIVIDDDVNPR